MTTQASLELFERAAQKRGRILRVEADRAEGLPRILALTFDVGRIVVRPLEGGLGAEAVADRTALPAGLVALDEEDPWWRVLGQPITAAWPIALDPGPAAVSSVLAALKLRFRESDQNPRVIAIAAAGPALRVTLEGH